MIVLALGIQLPAWATPANDAPKRPTWCLPGWICLPREEVSAATERLIDLQEQIARLKVRSRHFGCVGGVGLGISGVVTDKYDAKAVPAGHAGVTCGWVF